MCFCFCPMQTQGHLKMSSSGRNLELPRHTCHLSPLFLCPVAQAAPSCRKPWPWDSADLAPCGAWGLPRAPPIGQGRAGGRPGSCGGGGRSRRPRLRASWTQTWSSTVGTTTPGARCRPTCNRVLEIHSENMKSRLSCTTPVISYDTEINMSRKMNVNPMRNYWNTGEITSCSTLTTYWTLR